MILFSARKRLEDAYKEWLKENPDIADCPLNVISFFQINNLLDEIKVKEYLED